MNKYHDKPLAVCDAQLRELMRPGVHFYQKWTCENCGDRVTGNTADRLFTHGHHEDCGHTTDLSKCGCGYSIHAIGKAAFDYLDFISQRK